MKRRNKDHLGVRRRKRRGPTDLSPIRRRELERLVRGLGLVGTDDSPRFLMAWVWHNRKSTRPIEALIFAAERMGARLTDADAREVLDVAWDAYERRHMTPDGLAEWLGLSYATRQKFHLRTIGACDVGRAARKVLRKRQNRLRQETKRRAAGARPRTEYEARSLSATKPWEVEGMSRRTWYRRRNKAGTAVGTSMSAAFLSKAADGPVPTGTEAATEPGLKKQEDFRLATANVILADAYESLPVELRLAALCLPIPQDLARAA
jgi:hypothetical protein